MKGAARGRPIVLALAALCLACASPPSLREAAACYRDTSDGACLATVFAGLRAGMPRREVEALLGEPDYSPTEGQYYYGTRRSDASAPASGERTRSSAMIVDYRDASLAVTDRLQKFWMADQPE